MKCNAIISWRKSATELFTDTKYSRVHQWSFDGGMQFNASSSPHIVPLPMSDPSLIDPEEAFVASIASCHMLFFLSFCAREKFIVSHYEDRAVGTLGENETGKKQMLSVMLRPAVAFEGDRIPSEDAISRLHELAHENCFIANSVTTKIIVAHKETETTES